jgi:hypothetical protein
MATLYEIIKGMAVESAKAAQANVSASTHYLEWATNGDLSTKKHNYDMAKAAQEAASLYLARGKALQFVLDDMPRDMGERVIE